MPAPLYLQLMSDDVSSHALEALSLAGQGPVLVKAHGLAQALAAHGVDAGWITSFHRFDVVAWDAMQISDCLARAGLRPPANPVSAGAYRRFGVECGVQWGAIAVRYRHGAPMVGLVEGVNLSGAMASVLTVTDEQQVVRQWMPIVCFDTFRAPADVLLGQAPVIAPQRRVSSGPRMRGIASTKRG